METGSVVDKTGYGISGQGVAQPVTFPAGTKRDGENKYELYLDGTTVASSVLLYDFDDGTAAHDTFSLIGADTDLGLGNDEVLTAPGDSGGPSLLGGKIAGVTSFDARLNVGDSDSLLDSSFGEIGGDTRVSVFASWIDSVTDIIGPTVTGVTIASTLSSSSPYNVPDGSGEQLRTVPVGQANQVTIHFSESVTVSSGDLTLVSNHGQSFSVSDFSTNGTAHTATWTFSSAFTKDQIEIDLSDNVVDANGNHLDGEWNNPTALTDTGTSTWSSGDSSPGGSFAFYMTILPGDANRDNKIDLTDYGIVVNHLGQAGTWETGDTDGSGTVDLTDYGVTVNGLGTDYTQWPGSSPMMRGDFGGDDLPDWDLIRDRLDASHPDWDFIDSLGLDAGAVDRLMTLLS